MYHSSRGKRYAAVDEAHRRLGPVVRISSSHISFYDPNAYKEIYNYGSKIVKDDFYQTLANGNPSMAQTASKAEHSARRRNLSHIFSAQQIGSMEARIQDLVRKLCDKVDVKSHGQKVGPDDRYPQLDGDGSFDLCPWLNMFAFDAITTVFWSHSYGFLDKGNDLCSAKVPSGETKQVNAMYSFHSNVQFSVCLAHLPPSWYKLGRKLLKYVSQGPEAGTKFSGMVGHLIEQRLKNPPSTPDLFSHLPLVATEKRPEPMSAKVLHAECTTMLDAGSDTTQTSLNNCIYHLARHPDKQSRLRKELLEAVPPGQQPVASYAVLQNIPYLRACLDESFRCRTPLGFGLPRKVIDEGVTVLGHHITPGTVISAPLYSLHLNDDLFQEAKSFIPERWIPGDKSFETTEQEQKNLKRYVLPFSLGSRACIGRNLAYMELSITIAALIMQFEWELADPSVEMDIRERFNSNPVELKVRAKKLMI